jgi:hypothetical protein
MEALILQFNGQADDAMNNNVLEEASEEEGKNLSSDLCLEKSSSVSTHGGVAIGGSVCPTKLALDIAIILIFSE